MEQATRFPWNHFPAVYIHASEHFVKTHHAYAAANAGDVWAATELVADAITPRMLEQLWKRFDDQAPVLVNARAQGTVTASALSDAMAHAISAFLRWPRERRIIQTNKVSHTGASGYERLQRQATFDGRILIGLNYLLVDEFIGHGGTLANLRGHILAQKGCVIGATVLMGRKYSAELTLRDADLSELRRRYGHIEYWWRKRFGFGFESLTASEARFLRRNRTVEGIIERLEAVDGCG
jgi:adenine/guanine phosphoribosyltransferase-like PRPP-binding protein